MMKFEDFKMDPTWSDEHKNIYASFYREIWEEGEYDRFGVSVKPDDLVVDCGASIGLFTNYALSKGAKKVVSFEAAKEIYDYFCHNTDSEMRGNNQDVLGINGFVGSGEGQYNLGRIFTEFNLPRVDFMKVDIEGAEYSFILDAPDEYIQKVDKWAIELHVWGMFQNQATEYSKCFQLIEKFSKNGFRVSCEHIHKNTCLYMMYVTR